MGSALEAGSVAHLSCAHAGLVKRRTAAARYRRVKNMFARLTEL
jgi:hypothetical protein